MRWLAIFTLFLTQFSNASGDNPNAAIWLKKLMSRQSCAESEAATRACTAVLFRLGSRSMSNPSEDEALDLLDAYYGEFYQDSHVHVVQSIPYFNLGGPVDQRVGVGLTGITHEKAGLRVRIVGPHTPAEKSGFQVGDLITAIDEKTAAGPGDLADAMGGELQSTSKFKIIRNEKPITISVTREAYDVPWVLSKKEGDVGVIRILTFALPNICSDAKRAVDDLTAQGVKSITLDLRENGGGDVKMARCVAGLFLPIGQILYREANLKGEVTNEWSVESPEPVYTEVHDSNSLSQSFGSNQGSMFGAPRMPEEELPPIQVNSGRYPINLPMKVLVNARTASASELLASAFQDYKRAKIEGEVTFGKGCGQITEDIEGASNLKIFRTRYYFLRPNGGSVQRVGITPDEITEASAGEVLREADVYPMSPKAYSNTSVR